MLDVAHSLDPEPQAEQRPLVTTRHGIAVEDEYAWLKAANWQEVVRDPQRLDPAIRSYLDAENEHAERALADTAALQELLFAEMKARIKEDDSSVPAADGEFAYYMRFRQGGQHPLMCRRHAAGDEEILLDGDATAGDRAYFQLGAVRHSPDHRLLAWSADDAGSEFYAARIRDIRSGRDLPDLVPDVSGSVVWTRDATAFYYVRLDRNHRPAGVFRHRLGTAASDDVKVFDEPEHRYFLSVSRLQSGTFAEVSVHDHETSEAWLIDLADDDAAPMPIAARAPQIRYDVEHHPDLFGGPALLFRTNADGAEDFKIAWAPLADPRRENWRDLVPHRAGIFVLAFGLFADWLFRLERENGLPRIVVRRLSSGEEHSIAFTEEAYSLGLDAGYEFQTDTLRFTYSSMTTPSEVWDYDLAARTRVLRKRQEIPSGHDPSAYVTRRIFAPAPDGETVPISLIHRADVTPDGTAPCLLYGYGAYGMSMPAGFGASRLSLVDRGFVYAIAHVRGGTEKGWRWYLDGKLANKPHTFSDFIAAAEHLAATGWAAPDKIVIHGGSAGGLLMGAVTNQRPDLFAGVIAEAPFVDALSTMLDDTLPLTPPEWPEWGNPIEDPDAFRMIASYSPYDNVAAQDYPAMLVLAGLTDPRVTYWEPARWVARLRSRRTNRKLLVLRTNMDAGHSGASGRFDRLKEVALTYAFAIRVIGGKLTG